MLNMQQPYVMRLLANSCMVIVEGNTSFLQSHLERPKYANMVEDACRAIYDAMKAEGLVVQLELQGMFMKVGEENRGWKTLRLWNNPASATTIADVGEQVTEWEYKKDA